MSQSDYIKYKKSQRVLKEQADFPKVLAEQDYTSYETYGMETSVSNTKIRHSKLIPSGHKIVMNMDRVLTSCPTFVLCTGTNARTNRKLNTFRQPPATLKIDRLTHKQIVDNAKTPIENSVKCDIQKSQYITRRCTCYKLPKLCKCGTQICEGTPVVPG